MGRWNLDAINWKAFDPAKVDPNLLILAKTASVVEYNSADYVSYLHNVFSDDAVLKKAVEGWGQEEIQHGLALAKWAKLADPSFDFEKSLENFREAFKVPVESTTSIRGSRSAELVARCLVECGTTSYYSSLADVAEEPVFKQVCQMIAADEVHHYTLFYRHLQNYLGREPMSLLERCKVAVARSMEASSEELLFAYAATNLDGDIRYEDLPVYNREYLGRVCGIYTLKNLRVGIKMGCRAAGLEKFPRVAEVVSRLVYHVFQSKARKLNRPAA